MTFEQNLLQNDFSDIIGLEEVKKQAKSALLMGRHIILVGQPGMGKTTLAKNIAKLLPAKALNNCPYHCTPDRPMCPVCQDNMKAGKPTPTKQYTGQELFVRIQGSPDLTAEDLLGDIDPIKAMQYGPMSITAFTPGKIFKANQGILFFDEINRCSEKLQNALLQALEEKKVTIGSYTVDLDADFIFVATMNPNDNSTEPLSDVLLDRFDLIYVNYPETQEDEEKIVDTKANKFYPTEDTLAHDIVDFIRQLRNDQNLEKKPSVRASLGLFERAQSHAKLCGKEHADWDDVSAVLLSVLAHRIKLKPSVKYLQTNESYLQEHLETYTGKRAGAG
ncbi:AAA family ATPase [Candidatus Woesearchaeota archaeon]|nr:AAA family ATPase [Candidatus Woesearchaeota archaeon]